MTIPCSLLSLIRFVLPTPGVESLLLDSSGFSRASHLAAGHVSDTPVKRGSDAVVAASDSSSISFVSYFSFVSKRSKPRRSIAIWSQLCNMTRKRPLFSSRHRRGATSPPTTGEVCLHCVYVRLGCESRHPPALEGDSVFSNVNRSVVFWGGWGRLIPHWCSRYRCVVARYVAIVWRRLAPGCDL